MATPHRIAVIGGGPGGLYAAALLKRLDPTREVTVWERNAPDDTFGFGVVLSDETLGGIEHADPAVYTALQAEFVRWDDIDIVHRDRRHTCGGHGFAALGRRRLLEILHDRCRDLGIELRFRTEAPPASALAAEYDLVVAADGVHSLTREAHADVFGPTLTTHRCRYIWLAADFAFDAFRFEIAETEHGVMQLHGYPYSSAGTGASTVIVEMREEVWEAAGFAELDEHESTERCAKIFADALGGRPLRGNTSSWINFRTVVNSRWFHGNTVLLGDAAHTAHFSIGSGTKLAVEDALALAACLEEQPDIPAALRAYEEERRPVVASTQRAARASLEWFERLPDHLDQPPRQFAFNLLTRSRRVTHDNLRLRDADFTRAVERDFGCPDGTPPMFTPFRLRDLTLRNRVVVSPMDMYSAVDGVPGDFHLVHLGARALGGAGLVMTEMVCVSERGRITPGCAGLYTDEQAEAWRRVTDFVHEQAPGAAIGLQLGHSGRKGSTKRMWEGIDDPLPDGNWPLDAASPLPYKRGSQVPRELSRAGLTKIREQFVSAARRADRAGFDLLELHAAHGYLLSGFLSPLTNRRTDAYGGDLPGRLRYPLEVFDAVREVWPAGKPMTVRISATDWAEGGTTAEDAVEIARAFAGRGADAIDVSTGQVVADERPEFGRSYQTPYADRIRNVTGVPVITVGAVSSWDDVNSLLLAGRTDLCALARPHLYDPHWTLHAAAEQGYAGEAAPWPLQYRAGSRRPQTGRTDAPKQRLQLPV
ncbi:MULTISPECIES: bifunctional salicylyl-CoA 5-hydroxylase/oxidoreductase [unclassified Streptomyces]|uniref:bifunctional salicylyl-CoA 5-hydroxylase/oxidoreductase n=1 Tax=unclassified Streptomyces TaxID=2593676 RepID=UPI00136D7A7D|nr:MULTISPECIES: bifunctional salicylyl-CoA 5-hydroxylase/oxidoreductase [unclassified Streptomyces]NEA06059.1 bifunctional salicylyl-CoA 5-hydroxylase/oxidoreductase [Streptomyces sp. SID10116]MYY82150.1 bifunctional salicylyl-CoA 5-hydroxylase/oxidoreductase [Streptomyces sp. SID335]MYZ17509.1 bifunctional salicylyl-CoA 5-hydroxylase/oxidoreductase [Streptomyces sp. SID337]NDZ89592.1 bifunctional salicylyl-CoA 5-hydroxylase/oxidoreductase [Streptomyces sp. SID10115]NEB46707.1 bifunctional sa